MADRPVHWHEGMFLGPQHLQAAQRYESAQRRKTARAGVRYNWGIQALRLNQTALANHRFEVHALQAFLRDGSLVDLPEDGPPPVVDLRADLERTSPLMVLLALPSFRSKGANAADNGSAADVRFLVETQPVEDENTGTGDEPVGFRLLNARVLLSNEQEHKGFDTVPLARLIKSAEAETAPQLDPAYIPPLLCCDAWPPLQVDILRRIYDRIGAKIDLLSEQMRSRGITIESLDAEDVRIAGQLRALNEAYTVLGIVAFAEGIHPLQAYLELCRIVGQLSIHDPTRLRPPALPAYDHDNLGYIFNTVAQYIHGLLALFIEPEWKARPFKGAGLRMQVDLEPAWLEQAWQMFVAVQSTLTREECVSLFTDKGKLDMKIGSSDRVDALYMRGQMGLKFTHLTQPRSLPASPRLTYFQVARDAQPAEWTEVRKSMKLAVRVNERLATTPIEGAETITIKNGKQEVPVRLTLYVTRTPS
jgi:type VI secretion system protein ImpJ